MKLPIDNERDRILNACTDNKTVILLGETACGKTTRVPQFLLAHNEQKIVCTQPRRIAAVSCAERVAFEMGCECGGDLVGYSVRFEQRYMRERTRLVYMTDGMLVREAVANDANLSAFNTIILDEVHERTIQTDLLLALVKRAQNTRKDRLHVILMSATMDVDLLSNYFDQCPVVYVCGRPFRTRIYNCLSDNDDGVEDIVSYNYLQSTLKTIDKLHTNKPRDEGILVFLTGQEEIESSVKTLNRFYDQSEMRAFTLFSNMSMEKQSEVCKWTDRRKSRRKVVIATNVAETSLTISGIRHVIDCGFVKQKIYTPTKQMSELKIVRCSKAQAIQRAGRAGREGPGGTCYRLYSKSTYLHKMNEQTQPEIERSSLESVLLSLVTLGFVDPLHAVDFLSRPSDQAILHAIEVLATLHFIEKFSNGTLLKLTKMGHLATMLPIEPRLSGVLLAAAHCVGCVSKALSLIAVLSVESVLKNEARSSVFFNEEGDHFTLVDAFNAFRKSKQKAAFCKKNELNAKNLLMACSIRRQLKEGSLIKSQISEASSANNNLALLKCLASGFRDQMAQRLDRNRFRTLNGDWIVFLHPSSAAFNTECEYVIYGEVVSGSGVKYLRTVSCINEREFKEIEDFLRNQSV